MRSETKRGFFMVLWICLCASPTYASCINPALTPEYISQFKSNPQSLIPTPDVDARTVEAAARDLAGTDPTLASNLVRIARDVPPRFRSAIAAGLAQAALACLSVDQQAALQIQQAVASYEDGQFQALFAAVVGDLSTAATAAAESAATGSLGSVVVVNPVGKGSANFVAGGGQGSIVSSPSGIFTFVSPIITSGTAPLSQTAANPVSATR
jgi:hypothetical protein